MSSDIKIVEKPDWVSWDDIHNTLWKAHTYNREKGMAMRYASLSGDEIRERVEGKGKMICAIKGDKLIGTAAIVTKKAKLWFDKNPATYAYLCFACVSPDFASQGVYRQLYMYRERACVMMGLKHLMFDTHEKNRRVLEINSKNHFRAVDYKFYNDHFNIVMVKWLDGCPYPSWYIKLRFLLSKFKQKTRYKMVPGKGRVKRFGL